jgi:molecular chaperone DnaJ
MAPRNYYVVLGVASNETEQGVRTAFRELAKRYHPDRIGPEGATPFRELVEAYETLGDPDRRSRYDESLRQARPRPGSPDTFVRDVSLHRDFADLRPSEDALLARLARNFSGALRNDGVQELHVELAISEDEAGRGARVRFGIPVFSRCPYCVARGCTVCRGFGMIEREQPVTVDIPPFSGSGTTFILPLSGLGIHNSYARVRVRIDKGIEPPA